MSGRVNVKRVFTKIKNYSSNGLQILGLYAVMVVVFSLLSKQYFSLTNFKLMAANFSIGGIIAAGVFFPMLAGVFDLSIGGIASLVSVMVVFFFNMGLPTPVVILLSLLIGVAVGAANGFVCKTVGVNPIITTIGTGSVVTGLAKWISTSIGSENIYNETFRAIGSTFIANKVPLLVLYMVAIYAGLSLLLRYSNFGRKLYAVGGGFEIARMAGIHSKRVQYLTYIISGAFAAFGAVLLVSQLATGRPEFGLHFTLDAITICVLGGLVLGGGRGDLLGVFMAVLLLGSIANGLIMLGISFYIRFVVTGFFLIVSIIVNELRFRRS